MNRAFRRSMLIAAAVVTSCGSIPELNGTQEQTGCELGQDRHLVYSNVRVIPESGDLTGVEFELIRDPLGIWRGVVTFAEGEMGLPARVSALDFDPDKGSLAFTAKVDEENELRFTGSINCDEVTGQAEVYEGTNPASWTLKRIDRCEDSAST